MTNFEKGLASMGVPVLGAQGFMTSGKSFFVDPKYGSNGNKGTSIDKAFKSLNVAETHMRDGYGDVVYLVSNGGTASADITTYLTETLVWDKNRAHIIGLAAPSMTSPRARVSVTSTTAVNPLLQITGHGSVFANFQVYNGIDAAVAANGVEVTGERNVFYKVHFAGIGNAKNDIANAYSLKLTGGGENLFVECVIGIDTIAKGSAANSEIVFASATARNTFKNCIVRTLAEAAGHQFILAGASAIEGTQIFENCTFESKLDGGGVAMTEAISINATQNGRIKLVGYTNTDAADWEASPTGIVVENLQGSDPGIVADVA